MTAHLNDEKIDKIVQVIDGWTGRLTWADLVDAIAVRLGESPTRQALSRHTRIAKAVRLKKKLLRQARPELKLGRAEVEKLHEQLGRLKSENARLSAENTELLDQFRRWAYNASIAGLSKTELNRPLPQVDRKDPK
jgi:hypothetical protein